MDPGTATIETLIGGEAAEELGLAAVLAPEVVLPILAAVVVGAAIGFAIAKAVDTTSESCPAKSEPKAESETEDIPCFKVPDGADRDEFERQLKEQQDALNNMSPEEYQRGRQKYSPDNRVRTAQDKARRKYQAQRTKELYEENLEDGMTSAEAEAAAKARAKSEMGGLDATHELDMIAGGDPSNVSGLGDSSVNRSIGSQWKDRVGKLDELARKAKDEGEEKMDVELKVCD